MSSPPWYRADAGYGGVSSEDARATADNPGQLRPDLQEPHQSHDDPRCPIWQRKRRDRVVATIRRDQVAQLRGDVGRNRRPAVVDDEGWLGLVGHGVELFGFALDGGGE